MPIMKRIHCVADVEPPAYHKSDAAMPTVVAINLNLECVSAAIAVADIDADESAARAAFAAFLRAVRQVSFHVYEVSPDGEGGVTLAHQGPVATHIKETALDEAPVLNWLTTSAPISSIGGSAPVPGTRYWSQPQTPGAAEATVAVEDVGATHLLRGSQDWSAPVPHAFGLHIWQSSINRRRFRRRATKSTSSCHSSMAPIPQTVLPELPLASRPPRLLRRSGT